MMFTFRSRTLLLKGHTQQRRGLALVGIAPPSPLPRWPFFSEAGRSAAEPQWHLHPHSNDETLSTSTPRQQAGLECHQHRHEQARQCRLAVTQSQERRQQMPRVSPMVLFPTTGKAQPINRNCRELTLPHRVGPVHETEYADLWLPDGPTAFRGEVLLRPARRHKYRAEAALAEWKVKPGSILLRLLSSRGVRGRQSSGEERRGALIVPTSELGG